MQAVKLTHSLPFTGQITASSRLTLRQPGQQADDMCGFQIAIEILLVLEPIHRRKFLHRDLKPHNICVYNDPLGVRLLDFGLSKPFQEGEGYAKVTKRKGGKAAEIPGSPHYMAEEQFLRPKEVDERTDLYAVGIVLYEMIAGVPPFRGIYLQDILKQHRDKEPQPRGEQREYKRLSEELGDDTGPTRTQRGADGNLTGSLCGAGQNHDADVSAP